MLPDDYGEDYRFPHQMPDGTVVWLFVSKRGRAKFFTAHGRECGPEHESVSEAVTYVIAEGWHEWGGYTKAERDALREQIWKNASGDSRADGANRRVTIVDRKTGERSSKPLLLLDDRSLMRLSGLTKTEPRMRRNGSEAPMTTREEFIELVRAAAPQDRQLTFPTPALGGSEVFVNYFNLPPGIGDAGGGAERQNNRMMFTVRGDRGGWSPERVKIELTVSALPREFKLRAKSGPPRAVAKYLTDFLAKVRAEVPPKYTHTTPPKDSMRNNGIGLASQHGLGAEMASSLHARGYLDVRNPDTGQKFRIREKIIRKPDRIKPEGVREYFTEDSDGVRRMPRVLSEAELENWLSNLRPVLRATTMTRNAHVRNERVSARDLPHNINGVELHDEPQSNGARVTSGSSNQHDPEWFEVDLGPYGSALAKSNYRSLRDLLMEKHPLGSSDEIVWAKLGGDSIVVKYGDLARSEREAIDAMSEYPALDDSDLSREETEQQEEAWDNWAGREFEEKFVASVAAEVDADIAERVESEGLPSGVDVGPLFRQALGEVQGEWTQESDGGWFIHRFEPAIERSVEIFMGREPARGSHVQAVIDELRSAWGMGGALVANAARVEEEGAGDYAVEFTTPTTKHRIRRTTLQAASEEAVRHNRQSKTPIKVMNKRKVVMEISRDGKIKRPGAKPVAKRAPAKRGMRRNASEVSIPRPGDDRVLRFVIVEGYRLMTWDTGRIGTGELGKRGKRVLGYAFWDPSGNLLFSGEDYYKAPGYDMDGDETLRDLLSFFLSDIDDENETPEQKEFRRAEEHGMLNVWASDPDDDEEPMEFEDLAGGRAFDDEDEGFEEGIIEELAKARFRGAHRIDVTNEHDGWYVQVDDDQDEPVKNYSVVKTGAGQGFHGSGYDFEEL